MEMKVKNGIVNIASILLRPYIFNSIYFFIFSVESEENGSRELLQFNVEVSGDHPQDRSLNVKSSSAFNGVIKSPSICHNSSSLYDGSHADIHSVDTESCVERLHEVGNFGCPIRHVDVTKHVIHQLGKHYRTPPVSPLCYSITPVLSSAYRSSLAGKDGIDDNYAERTERNGDAEIFNETDLCEGEQEDVLEENITRSNILRNSEIFGSSGRSAANVFYVCEASCSPLVLDEQPVCYRLERKESCVHPGVDYIPDNLEGIVALKEITKIEENRNTTGEYQNSTNNVNISHVSVGDSASIDFVPTQPFLPAKITNHFKPETHGVDFDPDQYADTIHIESSDIDKGGVLPMNSSSGSESAGFSNKQILQSYNIKDIKLPETSFVYNSGSIELPLNSTLQSGISGDTQQFQNLFMESEESSFDFDRAKKLKFYNNSALETFTTDCDIENEDHCVVRIKENEEHCVDGIKENEEHCVDRIKENEEHCVDRIKENEEHCVDRIKENEDHCVDGIKENEDHCVDRIKENEEHCVDRIKENEDHCVDGIKENEEHCVDRIKENEDHCVDGIKENEEHCVDRIKENEEKCVDGIKENEDHCVDRIKENEEHCVERIKENEEHCVDGIKENEEHCIDRIKENEDHCVDRIKENEEHCVDRIKENEDHCVDRIKENEEHCVDRIKENEEHCVDRIKENEDHCVDGIKENEDHCVDRINENEDHCVDGIKENEEKCVDGIKENEDHCVDRIKENEDHCVDGIKENEESCVVAGRKGKFISSEK